MSQVRRSSSMVLMFVLTLAALAVFAVPAFAQEDPNPAQDDRGYAQQDSRGYVADWSSHHNIFSNPGSEKKALDEGKYDHWLKVTNHQRFIMQENRRNRQFFRGGIGDNGNNGDNGDNADNGTGLVHKDWSMKDGAYTESTYTVTITGNNVTTSSTVSFGGTSFAASKPSGGQVTGTFTNTPTTGSLTITNSNGAGNTFVLTPSSGTPTSGTITVVSVPTIGDLITIGGTILCFDTTADFNLTCELKGDNNIVEMASTGATTVNVASILATTINEYVASVSAGTPPANVVTVSNLTGAAVAWTTSDTAKITLSPTGSITANTSAVVGCPTNAQAGTFANPSLASTPNEAAAVAAAITSCNTSFPATIGVTASASSNVVTFSGTNVGNVSSGLSFASTLTNFTLSSGNVPNGSDGANCSTIGTPASCTALTFKYTTNGVPDTAAQLAADIDAAVGGNATVTGEMSLSYSGSTTILLSNKSTTPRTISETNFTDFTPTTGSLAANSGGTTVIPSTYPAKWGFNDTSSGACATGFTNKTIGDYVVYPTGAAGSNSQTTGNPNIIAYDNLYLGCPTSTVATTPGLMYAYYTPAATGGSTYTTGLSPTISFTGDQVAYVETSSSGSAYLVILRWAAALAANASFTCTASNSSPTTLTACTTTVPSAQIVGATFPTTTDIPTGTYVTGFSATAKSITMSAAATGLGTGTGTITIATPRTTDDVVVNGVTFCFTTPCTGGHAVVIGGTNTITATNLTTAINAVPVANVHATSSAAVVTITDTGTTTITISSTSGTREAISPFGGSISPSTASVTFTLKPPTMTAPYILPLTTPANYRACTAPCYTAIAFNGGANDTYSSPFPTYNSAVSDSLFVGDNAGKIHKFTGVFAGAPAESTSGWPVTTAGAGDLNSPVYDGGASGLVYVTDNKGYLYSVPGAAGGSSSQSAHLDCGSAGFADAPYVDSSAEEVYVFNGGCSGTPSSIIQFPAATITGSGTAASFANTPDAGTVQYQGAFDNTYYTSGPTAGNLYGCVNGTVYQVPMSSFGTGVNPFATLGTSTSDAATCSPVAEYYNSSTSADYLFVSLAANGTGSGCGSGCLYGFSNANSTPTGSIVANGGTTGIVMDNSGTGTGQSNIYYNSLNSLATPGCTGVASIAGTSGVGTCAVQVTQTAP